MRVDLYNIHTTVVVVVVIIDVDVIIFCHVASCESGV